MSWYIGQIVVLDKKKKNGYPNGRKIGDKLEVVSVMNNPKCVRLVFGGNRRLNDKFTLHESYVISEAEFRDRQLGKILEEDDINKKE